MKISIAWIFDHIDADVTGIDVQKLIDRFNSTTAEIEGYNEVKLDLSQFTLAHVKSFAKKVTVHSPEWDKEIKLAMRDDTLEGDWYLIIKRKDAYDWATTVDLGGEKDMVLPALEVPVAMQKGGWKKRYEAHEIGRAHV